MVNYNLTNLTTAENLSDVAGFANGAAQGHLFGMALLAAFFIMLMALKKWEMEGALIVSSWTAFIFGVILAYGGWVNIIYPLGFLVVAAFATLWAHASGRL